MGMATAVAQPIAGVSANRETEIEVLYPSVASGALGRAIGVLMGSAAHLPFTPLRLLASVILGMFAALLGLPAYFLNKIFGDCYVITNRSVQARRILGGSLGKQVALGEIVDISIAQQSGYAFHRVGDLVLEDAQGNPLMRIPAISFPHRARQILLDAQSARRYSDDSLAVIQGRSR